VLEWATPSDASGCMCGGTLCAGSHTERCKWVYVRGYTMCRQPHRAMQEGVCAGYTMCRQPHQAMQEGVCAGVHYVQTATPSDARGCMCGGTLCAGSHTERCKRVYVRGYTMCRQPHQEMQEGVCTGVHYVQTATPSDA